MLTISDAVIFLDDKHVVKEMLMSEFEALLDGIVELPEFSTKQVSAVFIQIDNKLKIRGLVSFLISFTAQGLVESDWNIPFQQLLQSASRGPDLGGGKIRLVCRSQCSVPWHQHNLWDPQSEHLQVLIQAVAKNHLSIEQGDQALDGGWDVPDMGLDSDSSGQSESVVVSTAPPLGVDANIPTLGMSQSIPTLEPVVISPVPTAKNTSHSVSLEVEEEKSPPAISEAELSAMKSAYAVKVDRLQKSYDELNEKHQGVISSHQDSIASIKRQVKDKIDQVGQDFKSDLQQREQQLQALKGRLDIEQNRYSTLKEQQVEQAANSQLEREELLIQMQSDKNVGSEKIEQLQLAFKKELQSRMEAETAQANDGLAMREVELFYRDEQLALLRDDVSKLKVEKQSVITGSGNKVLSSLEDNGVTLVAFHEGVGHITIPSEDVGRYLDQRVPYLAERCQVSLDMFNSWQAHYNMPQCQYFDAEGRPCHRAIAKVELATSFKCGISDRCSDHVIKASDVG
ncbi:MAG: hypothetical protein HRU20_19170 [Pseudomonadales bacterium]|nr:hypothetical protein [Pseudomonadales bacterium]